MMTDNMTTDEMIDWIIAKYDSLSKEKKKEFRTIVSSAFNELDKEDENDK